MAVSLGKRKRARPQEQISFEPPRKSQKDEDDTRSLQDIFRQQFESKFRPLSISKTGNPAENSLEDLNSSESDDDEEEWEGFSEDEKPPVEVVEHTDTSSRRQIQAGLHRKELKAFMVSSSSMFCRDCTF